MGADLAWFEIDEAGVPAQPCGRCGGFLKAITRFLDDDDIAILAVRSEEVEEAKKRWYASNSRLPPKERSWWHSPLFSWPSSLFYSSDFDPASNRFVRRFARWYEVPFDVRSAFEIITGWRPANGECPACNGCLRSMTNGRNALECAHRDHPDCGEVVAVARSYGSESKRSILNSRSRFERWKLRGKLLHVQLVEELQQLMPPVSFDQLREHLHSTYLTYDLTDKRLREAITRAKRKGLLTVEVGRDGVARYRATRRKTKGNESKVVEPTARSEGDDDACK